MSRFICCTIKDDIKKVEAHEKPSYTEMLNHIIQNNERPFKINYIRDLDRGDVHKFGKRDYE